MEAVSFTSPRPNGSIVIQLSPNCCTIRVIWSIFRSLRSPILSAPAKRLAPDLRHAARGTFVIEVESAKRRLFSRDRQTNHSADVVVAGARTKQISNVPFFLAKQTIFDRAFGGQADA